MTRAIILVLDSLGIGGAPDAERFGDEGSNTLGHIAEACAAGHARRNGDRSGPLQVPHLLRLGLGNAARSAAGAIVAGLEPADDPDAQWGVGIEISNGKDTPSGHWEIAGVPVRFDWGYFPDTVPCFPEDLVRSLLEAGKLPGILGNCHASGTEIIARLGEEHMATGKPIVYTSADSVLQIACHETSFGLERLYDLCGTARRLVDPLNIGRVIARPFVGGSAETFVRTANRKDFSVPPPEPTLLDRLETEGRSVISIGKIGDIFAHRGTGRIVKAAGNEALFEAMLLSMEDLEDGGLMFVNFVDFDTLYGHRRDVAGYAGAIESFDRLLPRFLDRLQPGDMAVMTADHGCDPTWTGTDHTRECVPILCFGPDIRPGSIGRRTGFADIGQTVAAHLGIAPLAHGTSWVT